MKRVIPLFVVLLSISFVSAYWGGYGDPISGFSQGMQQLIEFVEQVFGPLFSVILGGSSDMLFERVMFLAIILAIVYIVSSNIEVLKKNKAVVWIVTVAVSLLSTRFLMESELVQTMMLPYGVLGVSLSAFLPLVIYFMFVEGFTSSTLRKILWIGFIVVFMVLWSSRYNELGELAWIYFFTGVVAFLFMLFDGTIRRAMEKQQFGVSDFDGRMIRVGKLQEDLEDLDRRYSAGYIPKASYDRMKKRLLKQIEDLRKH